MASSLSSFDVVIIGGGIAGLTLALALAPLPLRVALVEAKPLAVQEVVDFDARSLALSLRSIQFLQSLGVWDALQPHAAPIRTIHVSDRGHAGFARLQAEAMQVPAFGSVIELAHLARALTHALSQTPVQCYSPAQLLACVEQEGGVQLTIAEAGQEHILNAALVVAADGRHSALREQLGIAVARQDYQQTALVANIGLKRGHDDHAYERFTETGPLALLPLTGQRAALVWTVLPAQAEVLQNASEGDFLRQLQQAFGYRLGRFTKVGRRDCFPLQRLQAEVLTKGNILLLGNAAHVLHPIAGQGFNLIVRDIAALAELLAKRPLSAVPAEYSAARLKDQQQMLTLTDSLVRVFSNPYFPLTPLRDMLLAGLERAPVVKKQLALRMMGLSCA